MSYDWPALTLEARPWTRWWWLGSAVTEAGITRQMERFRDAGIGGVEISPIYGVEGEERRNILYLSPQWVKMLGHALSEGRRLGIGVDMILGSGWPFGGPWVGADDAAAKMVAEVFTVPASGRLETPIRNVAAPSAKLLTLIARSEDGTQTLELTERVDKETGRLDWTAPASSGKWLLDGVFLTGTRQKVKRAAPGGEGNVLDPFSGLATVRFLSRFDEPFAALPPGIMPRSFFNDSYEVFGANATASLFPEFERRRGYDLRRHLPALLRGEGDPDTVRRVRSDYRLTMDELLRDDFTETWMRWARGKGAKARSQAHGSPGNLLDLYAAADIPETEIFGPATLDLIGQAPLPGTPARLTKAEEEILICKMASSAAHVAGKPLCSSESFTWLGEHGRVPLAHVKSAADLLFTMGINHIFFHGTPYSPEDAAWPGWLFYASTHFGSTNSFWRDLHALNSYIARCQSFLQSGQPDSDVLLYFPYHDLLAQDNGTRERLHFLTVHNTRTWLGENLPGFTQSARRLWDRGYAFDFVSDRLLERAVTVADEDGGLKASGGGASYRVLLVAGCSLMPPETLERIAGLARRGATVLILGDLPADVPGLSHLEARRERLNTLREVVAMGQVPSPSVRLANVGKGLFLFGNDLESLLTAAGVRRESLTDSGIGFIRRRNDSGGRDYFLVNRSDRRIDGWVTLTGAGAARSVVCFDPMSGRRGAAKARAAEENGISVTQVYLQMEPGESRILRTLPVAAEGLAAWEYMGDAGEPYLLEGEWSVTFVEGGPDVPPPLTASAPASWTALPGADADARRAFSGTARYEITFDMPQSNGTKDGWLLDLGDVRHSARVRLNGAEVGTLIAPPFRLPIPAVTLKDKGNRLEVEVTNLMANRLADMDRRKVEWRKFFFVNIEYKPFDASAWEALPSGLLGQVLLVPYQRRQ